MSRLVPRDLLLLAVAAAALPVWGQEDPDVVFRTETQLMQVEVKVRGQDGKAVTDLEPSDFKLIEDGAPQQIVAADFVPIPARLAPRQPHAEPQDRPQPESSTAHAAPQTGPAPRTWVYIVTQSLQSDFSNVHRAIVDFVREDMREGMVVSLGGTPFTSDRELLLQVADAMLKGPFGGRRIKSGAWLPTSVDPLVEMTLRLENDREGSASIISYSDETILLTESIDRQIEQVGRLTYYRFLDLVQELSVLPGKKAVVLFRGGLRLDLDNAEVLSRLVGEAVRHRVSFYTCDSRGLQTSVPGSGRLNSVAFRNLRRGRLTGDRLERMQDSQHGLRALAKETGGTAATNTNDLGLAFKNMAADTGGYYLLSYRPTSPRETDLVRRIKIDVELPGVKLDYNRKYYEEKSFDQLGDDERAVHLHRALQFDSIPARLKLNFEGNFLRGSDGNAEFVYAASVHASELAPVDSAKGNDVAYSVAVQAVEPGQLYPEAYEQQSSRMSFDRATFQRAQTDPAFLIEHRGEVSVSPGRFRWKIVWRDDVTGEIGNFAAKFIAPAFTEPLSASTLLLTRRVQASDPSQPKRLDFGEITLEPESPHDYRAGERVYLLYDLYDVPEEMFDSPPPFQLGLLRGEEKVDEVTATSRVVSNRETSSLRYGAFLETTGLPAGNYTVIVMLPNSQERKVPYLYRTFTLSG